MSQAFALAGPNGQAIWPLLAVSRSQRAGMPQLETDSVLRVVSGVWCMLYAVFAWLSMLGEFVDDEGRCSKPPMGK